MNLNECIKTLNSLPAVQANSAWIKRLTELDDRLKKKNFRLVVLGQFKRGKTSLINALLGRELLPTAVVPLTSIVTVLKYGIKEKILVKFLNGKSQAIKRNQLSGYITESQNPKNQKQLDQVIIESHSSLLKNGLEIVDTPGVGSVYRHNTDLAYQYVPQADAGIFVVTADPPISESELKFLTSIKDYLAKIIFVQNKIDLVSVKDREESLSFSRKVITEATGIKNLIFYRLSAKKGAGIKDFRTDLIRLIEAKKEGFLNLSLTKKLLPLISEIKLGLKLEQQALALSLDELKRKAEIFQQEVQKLKEDKVNDGYILQGQAERLIKEVLAEDLEQLKIAQLPALTSRFEAWFKSKSNLSGAQLSQGFDKFLEDAIKSVFIHWRRQEEQKIKQSLQAVTARFSEQTNQLIKKIIDFSATLFNLKLGRLEADASLANTVEFSFSFDDYKIELDISTPVITRLPKFLARKILLSKMRAELEQTFDQHCGRSRWDFDQRIKQSLNRYRNKLDDVLDQTVVGIETALQYALTEKESKEELEAEVKKRISEQENFLSSLSKQLKNSF